MSAKIVRLARGKGVGKRPPPEQSLAALGNLPDIDADWMVMLRAFINGLVRDYVRAGGKINRLALKSGLGANTIHRLAYYETTRPAGHTIFAVIMALDAMPQFEELTARYNKAHGERSDE